MTISGERTEQLDIFFYRVAGFTSDFLSFIDVELIRFFHRALQLYFLTYSLCNVHAKNHSTDSNESMTSVVEVKYIL